MQKILVTGAAGFIGHNLSKKLLQADRTVVGLDNLNDYYDPELKKARLAQLLEFEQFSHANFVVQFFCGLGLQCPLHALWRGGAV